MTVPTIAVFYGIMIQMYGREHSPPHLHAFYQGFEALVAIDSGDIIGGKLPPKAVKIVRDWVLLRKAELVENWRRGRQGQPFQRIAGPDDEL